MKKVLLLLSLLPILAIGQSRIFGGLRSSLYMTGTNRGTESYYQALTFNAVSIAGLNLSFHTHLNVFRDGVPTEWSSRIYSGYLRWKSTGGDFDIRIGRQFLYQGVLNGSYDAVSFSTNFFNSLNLKLFSGLIVPFTQDSKLTKWDDGHFYGGFFAYDFSKKLKTNVSFVSKERAGKSYWQQVGFAISGTTNTLYYLFQYDHNLLSSTYQSIRAHFSYYRGPWTISADVSSLKPRIYEDSFFSIFKIKEHRQFRLAAERTIGEYRVGARIVETVLPNNNNAQQAILTFGKDWGTVGMIFQSGYAGDNLGFYGQLNYPLLQNLSVNLYSSHYRFQRHSIEVEEQATSFSAGFNYRPVRKLQLSAQLQQSINNFYTSDFRGLLTLHYRFEYK